MLALTPAVTPTPTHPELLPTAIPLDGGPISPCSLSLLQPGDTHQIGFLTWSPDGSSLIFDFDEYVRINQAV